MKPSDVVISFWQCMDSNDFFAAANWLSPDFECAWPQSGEVIHGGTNYAMINIHYPSFSPWRFRIEQLVVDGNEVVSDVLISDGIQQARAITISTVREGLISSQTEFWPESQSPAPWRQGWSGKGQVSAETLPVLERRMLCVHS